MGRVKKTDLQSIVVEPLGDTVSVLEYIAANERKKLDAGVVLVRVTHPHEDAERVIDRPYSGVLVSPGALGCLWSDGSTE